MSTDTARIDTVEAGWPWALPPVTTVHLTPRARLRRTRNRFLASAFARDLTAGWARSLAVFGAFGLLFFALLVFRGLIVAADMTGILP